VTTLSDDDAPGRATAVKDIYFFQGGPLFRGPRWAGLKNSISTTTSAVPCSAAVSNSDRLHNQWSSWVDNHVNLFLSITMNMMERYPATVTISVAAARPGPAPGAQPAQPTQSHPRAF
jgi:hypothetical protein